MFLAELFSRISFLGSCGERPKSAPDGWDHIRLFAPIAQLAEAPDLDSGRSGFDSRWKHDGPNDRMRNAGFPNGSSLRPAA